MRERVTIDYTLQKQDCCKDTSNHLAVNFDPIARDADIICNVCGAYIRMWDPN